MADKVPVQYWVLLGLFIVALVISGIDPYDQADWVLEVAPGVIAVIVLMATYRSFPMTPMVYYFVFFHSLVLFYGGHYTYALAPLGEWMKDWFGFTRNNYDKIGHFVFGFFPVIIAREIIMRTTPLKKGKMLAFLSVCVVGAAGAFYEFIEWWAALLSPETGDAFLGTQGYIWDTQSDMFFAFVGAIVGLIVFTRMSNRQMVEKGFLVPKKHHSKNKHKKAPKGRQTSFA